MTQVDDGGAILDALARVDDLRSAREADGELARAVTMLKAFQHARFERTYDDLLRSRGQSEAARFFLDDLYGPHDFSDRDRQFARIVPALVRLFPREIVGTVRQLAELHALSEALDQAMATALGGELEHGMALDMPAYGRAWRQVGQPAQRARQVSLMLDVGRALIRYTRNPLLRQSLKLMRTPARAAGLGALQGFLERGFDTFRRLERPAEFLETIADREAGMSRALFAGDPAEGDPAPDVQPTG